MELESELKCWQEASVTTLLLAAGLGSSTARAEDFLAVKRTQLKRGGDQAVGDKLEMEALHVSSAVPWLVHESVGRVDCCRDAGFSTGVVQLIAYYISNVH